MTLNNINGNLRDAYKKTVYGTIFHVDELINYRFGAIYGLNSLNNNPSFFVYPIL